MGIPCGGGAYCTGARAGQVQALSVGPPRAIEGVDRGVDIVPKAGKVAAFGKVEDRESIGSRLAKPGELLLRAHRVAHPDLAAHHFFAHPYGGARLDRKSTRLNSSH